MVQARHLGNTLPAVANGNRSIVSPRARSSRCGGTASEVKLAAVGG